LTPAHAAVITRSAGKQRVRFMPSAWRSWFARRLPRGGFHWLGCLAVRRPLVVIGFWIATAAVLLLTLPPLSKIAGERPPDFLPSDSQVSVAGEQMDKAFNEPDSENTLLVGLSNETGLTPQDEAVYGQVVDNLRADTRHVVQVQDFIRTPALRDAMTSTDHKAWNLPVGVAGALGTPGGDEATKRAIEIIKETTKGTSLKANVFGPAATVGDLTAVGDRDQHVVEIVTALMVLAILLLVYRNPITMIVPLATIGISLVIAQQIIAGLVELGLNITSQSTVLISGMMFGAGTDYAVFFISRYHEMVRRNQESDEAVVSALSSIGKVMAASAGTVAITFVSMSFAKMGFLSTIGPALAVTVAIGFLTSITLLPAIVVLAGRRGWVKPRREITKRFWRRSGVHIVRRPAIHLLASLIILMVLAACAGLAKFNFDDRKNVPASEESNIGYAAMSRHFPENETVPQFLLIQSPHDLRTPEALADLDQMAQRVSQLPSIASVRGITRPTGETLEQAKTTYQAGQVGDKLNAASTQVASRNDDLDRLTGGANQIADTLGDVRGEVLQTVSSISGVADGLAQMQDRFGGTDTLAEIDQAAKLVTSMQSLGDAVGVNLAQVDDIYGWADPMLNALKASPVCDADTACRDSRDTLQRFVLAHDSGALNSIADLARQLQSTQATQSLDSAVAGLQHKLDGAVAAANELGLDVANGIQRQITDVQRGADTLADSSRQLADGVQLLVGQVRQSGPSLHDAAAFLMAMRDDARNPSMAGFYIPSQVLSGDEFKTAASMFVSPDGHAVRYLVQTSLNPFSTEAMDQVSKIIDTARGAQPNTTLTDASISIVGLPAANSEIRNYNSHDLKFIIVTTIIVVLAILILLLRAVVAPLYLIVSVMLSYLSALGIGVIVSQLILDRPLDWDVPGTAFIVLVAVGADYNLLLISRIREESSRGMRSAVIRTVGSTGGVITSAGVIFAASMFGLAFSSISGVVQVGFIIGVGLLIDTFLVRTVTVPAMALLVGRANWWPSRSTRVKRGEGTPPRLERTAAQSEADPSTESLPSKAVLVREQPEPNLGLVTAGLDYEIEDMVDKYHAKTGASVTRVDGSHGWRVFEWDNGSVHRYMWEQELLDMRCHYCKSPDTDLYMVTDDLWACSGLDGWACFRCLESAIGRDLVPEDFAPGMPANTEEVYHAPELRERIGLS
jgi:RND superfamily putative drug exporter